MKHELKYLAQLYLGFEVFSKCKEWILPSNMNPIILGEINKTLDFKILKEYYQIMENPSDFGIHYLNALIKANENCK